MLDSWWGIGPKVGLWVNILHVSALSVSSLVLPLILRDVSFLRLLQQCCSVSNVSGAIFACTALTASFICLGILRCLLPSVFMTLEPCLHIISIPLIPPSDTQENSSAFPNHVDLSQRPTRAQAQHALYH